MEIRGSDKEVQGMEGRKGKTENEGGSGMRRIAGSSKES